MPEINWLELWHSLVTRSSHPKAQKAERLIKRYTTHAQKRTERQDPLLDFILREIDITDTVVEIGSGTGRWTIPLAKTVKSVTAIEPTSGMADMLRENIRNAGLTNIDILSQTWQDASPQIYDNVICAHGMYGTPDLAMFVRKMERFSRKSCYMAMRMPPADGILGELSLEIYGCRHDSPDAVIAYNALYTMGIYSNVLVENDIVNWVNTTLEDAFHRAKKHLHLEASGAYDELIYSTLNRRLSFSDGVYSWPDGMRSALLWWYPRRK
ncbi:MAG: 16S ribosomal RNA methyltransferase KsgA/Dim1 family protein [Syntrophorhabdus sp. PtaU1.Bin153]|nr:MAG: 16S ribosomal RNA methyltransferase KsgA/Dim1 family protein [Syntrophorhabdus sp. PtaU1.Bin153]